MNVGKPTKWFLNLASKQKTIESPSNKLKKSGKKYENIKDVLTDVHGFYKNILNLERDLLESQLKNFWVI